MPGNDGRFLAAATGNASIARLKANEGGQLSESAWSNLMRGASRRKASALA